MVTTLELMVRPATAVLSQVKEAPPEAVKVSVTGPAATRAWAWKGIATEAPGVVLTPAGRALWGKIAPLYREVVAQITHGLSAKRLQDGLDLLKTLEAGATTWKLPNL